MKKFIIVIGMILFITLGMSDIEALNTDEGEVIEKIAFITDLSVLPITLEDYIPSEEEEEKLEEIEEIQIEKVEVKTLEEAKIYKEKTKKNLDELTELFNLSKSTDYYSNKTVNRIIRKELIQLEKNYAYYEKRIVEIEMEIQEERTRKAREEAAKRIEQEAKVKLNKSNDTNSGNKDSTYYGDFLLTAYCPCEKCCGQWSDGITCTGTYAQAGRTIAVDPNVIALGSSVIINGNTYIAEDCGGAIKGNKIDVYFNSHQDALNFGMQYNVPVYVVE